LLRKSGLDRPPSGPESVSRSKLIEHPSISFVWFLSSRKDMERCAAWGRYSSPKAATIDLDVSRTKATKRGFTLKILRQGNFPFVYFTLVMNTKEKY